MGCLIVTRPYIKRVVNEVKFTYVASEYKSGEINKLKKTETKKNEKVEIAKDSESSSETFSLEPDNSISLNAATTMNLFEDLEYDLQSVRNGQKFKPIYLTKLPRDLNTLGNTREKREVFIKIVLPLILDENEKIEEDRKKLFKILSKSFNTPGEKIWLKRRFREYKIEGKDLVELKMMSVIQKSQ